MRNGIGTIGKRSELRMRGRETVTNAFSDPPNRLSNLQYATIWAGICTISMWNLRILQNLEQFKHYIVSIFFFRYLKHQMAINNSLDVAIDSHALNESWEDTKI